MGSVASPRPPSLLGNSSSSSNSSSGEESGWKRGSIGASVSAVSFGFLATALLISIFLAIAIFERYFLRPRSTPFVSMDSLHGASAANSSTQAAPKSYSLLIENYSGGFTVLMPGQDFPTFLANPAPIPCPPEGILWPSHEKDSPGSCSFDSSALSPLMKSETNDIIA